MDRLPSTWDRALTGIGNNEPAGSRARDFPQLPLCERDRPSLHLVFFGVW
jgi:hypothetical protein